MIPLYSKEDFLSSQANDCLQCKCYYCDKPFDVLKKYIVQYLKGSQTHQNKYCSKHCHNLSKKTKISVNCLNCNISFLKKPSAIKSSPKHFCSKSCAATFNNKHKSKGNRRSKLEKWLQEQLTLLYPNLVIHYNQKTVINSELDIYIPSLNLAFELNGIFHYEPIYGVVKLQQIQENDNNKFQKCFQKNISLCIIDTSSQKYFKPNSSQKYLDIIVDIINQRTLLSNS